MAVAVAVAVAVDEADSLPQSRRLHPPLLLLLLLLLLPLFLLLLLRFPLLFIHSCQRQRLSLPCRRRIKPRVLSLSFFLFH